jgi:type 1 fimbria pilin
MCEMKRFSISGAAVVLLLCSWAGLAGANGGRISHETGAAKAPAGTITLTGKVTIDGNPTQTGVTVEDGSTIATLGDGDASIDLGALGLIHLRPNTTIKLKIAPNSCQVVMQRCGSMTQDVPDGVSAEVNYDDARQVEVAVRRGKVRINSERVGRNEKTDSSSLEAVKRKIVRRTRSVRTEGSSTFTLNCCGCCFKEEKAKNSNTRAE